MTTQNKSNPSPQATTAPLAAGRRYYEVFGHAAAEANLNRHINILLSACVVVLVIALLRLASRPPFVVRVDQLGQAEAFKAVGHEAAVTGPEVRNFSEHFVRCLTAWDMYTWDDDLNRAFGMMTDGAKPRVKQYLDSVDAWSRIKNDSLRTKVAIAEVAVEKDTPRVVRVKVRGTRLHQSYDKKDLRKEVIFEDVLTIRKVPRTFMKPWGLLVDEWAEGLFKE